MTPSGDCPVSDDTLVRVTFRDGRAETAPAWAFDWVKRGSPCDVVAWEIAERGATLNESEEPS